MAIQTVWSVDLGKSSLKAVKLRRDRNNVEIVAVDKVNYPLSANGVDLAAQQREALEVFSARNNIKEPVAVAHPGQGTFSRFIKVPAFDEKKVNEMVGYEASQQIPFPLDEVIWDFHIIDREYLPGEEREVALFAVRREAIDDFLLEFTNQELAVETVSIGYLGLLNFVSHDIAPEGPSVVLDIGATHTDLVLVDGDRFWIRPLPHSGNDITKAIQERFRLDYDKAERLKLETARVPPQKAVQIFQAVIQPRLKELVSEIHRSIGFYRSQHGETSFQKLYLLGNGSKIIGIKKFLEESLRMPVEKVASIQHFRVARDVNLKLLQADLPAFGTSLGAGLQALGLGSCKVDLVPQEEKLAKEIDRKKKHVFIAAGIVAVAMLIAAFLAHMKFKDAKNAYDDAKEVTQTLSGGSGEDVVYKQTNKSLQGAVDEIKKINALTPRVVESLQAMDKVLRGSFENDASDQFVFVVDKNDSEADRVHDEPMEAALFKRLWLPRAQLRRLQLERGPDGDFIEVAEKSGRRKKDPKAEPPITGFQFRVNAVVKGHGSAQQSVNFIREKFAKPLEEELVARGLELATKGVQTGTGSELAEVGLDKDGRPTAVIKDEETGDTNGQGGGPFYTVDVYWTVVQKLPKAPESEEDEFDSDDDDDDSGEGFDSDDDDDSDAESDSDDDDDDFGDDDDDFGDEDSDFEN